MSFSADTPKTRSSLTSIPQQGIMSNTALDEVGEGEALHDCTIVSFLSPIVGFKNHTHLWPSHQNPEEKMESVTVVLFLKPSELGKGNKGM